ncbi:MAG: hypothetical protein FJZ04_04175, partial [Candidatus Moranbacteria bacterium]|nr:hypothetical protein [Candidatus Moranbacteria bacterium]
MYGNQIVSCSGLDCSVCSLLEAFQHAFNWLLGLSAVTAVFLVTLAGLLYIFSLGKHKSLLKAKRSAKYAVAGLVFVLTAFLAVNTLFFLFGAASADNWFQIDCREDFAKEKLTKISSPKERTADLKFTIAAASSIFPSVSDPGKITGLDVAGVN